MRLPKDHQKALALLQAHIDSPGADCPAPSRLDMQMPGMDGVGLLEAHQQLPLALRRRIVVLMLNTLLSPSDQQRAEQFPIHGFIAKPLDGDKARDLLQQHFALELPAHLPPVFVR